ncbi:MAG: glycosyltransferase family 4 protein [Bryobacteraceae bacterium]
MRPYVLVAADFVRTGGMDRANLALATSLAERGHPVHVVTHRADEALSASPNVTVHRVPRPAGSNFLGEGLLNIAGRRCASSLRARDAAVLVNGGNCDWHDVNWVHYVHAAWRDPGASLRAKLTHNVFLRNERSIVPRCRLVFANSVRTRQDLIERLGVPAERIHVVYYGTEKAIETTGPLSRPRVAFIGAMSDRRKGFDTLFAAWRTLCADSRWDADLVVIGTGRALPAWKQRAEEAGLAARIEFAGFQRDVPSILRSCSALVSPVRYEAFGLAVQEALCLGVPALVSRDAGVAEVYPGELSALLIPDPEDAQDLVERLRHWRNRAAEYRQALAPLSARLRAYTWRDMAERMTTLMEQAQ